MVVNLNLYVCASTRLACILRACMYRELDLEEVKQAMVELNLYSNDHDLKVLAPSLCVCMCDVYAHVFFYRCAANCFNQ